MLPLSPKLFDSDGSGLPIALTIDCDSDQFDRTVNSGEGPLPTWEGVESGIAALVEATANCHDSFGTAPRFTWFVRVDPHLAALYGDCGYLLDRYSDLWSFCRKRGDELAWHPHLYRREGEAWVQELDPTRLRASLEDTWAALGKRGLRPSSCRIGDAFGSNEVLRTMSRLGLRCDATAMPGRVRRDADRQIDWEGTPQHPYHPSLADYRRPGTPAMELLEIPMSMVPVKAAYDSAPLQRYLDLSFHHGAVREGVENFLSKASLVVTVTHPSGVLPSMNGGHGLISHDIDEFHRNLEFILEECERQSRSSRFVTIAESERWFREGQIDVGQQAG